MIIPTIDISQGKAVQLHQGVEKIWESADIDALVEQYRIFPETNVIDIDAALGREENQALIKSLCTRLSCNVGGGVREVATAQNYLRAGAKHVIIGTKANKEFLKQLPKHRVLVALDIKDNQIAVEGWTKLVDTNLKDKIQELEPYCSGFLITNVNREGTGHFDRGFMDSLSGITKKRLLLSGGISHYEEIKLIDSFGFDSVLGLALRDGQINLAEAWTSLLDFSKGLIPTIAQDPQGNVLMVAFSNKESVLQSLKEKYAVYYSRSRQEIWKKGSTSGNLQKIISVKYDCDKDTLLYIVEPLGPACHTNSYSCFSSSLSCKPFEIEYLLSFLKERIATGASDSYTAKICQNEEKLHKKMIEETFEVTQAKEKSARIWEVADLLYFTLAYMAMNNLDWKEIINELSLRHRGDIDGVIPNCQKVNFRGLT